jgi:hypothetical protein
MADLLPDNDVAEDLTAAHERLRLKGRFLLDFPWFPDDFGKILFRLNQIAQLKERSHEEQQVARSLIRAAEQLVEQAKFDMGSQTETPEFEDEVARGESLLAELDNVVEQMAFQKQASSKLTASPSRGLEDKTRGPLWNMISWSLEPLHNASDERYWYIVAARIGLYSPPETLESIGTYLGITRERTRQVESRILDALQNSDDAWAVLWRERAAQTCSSDLSDFSLLLDAVIHHGEDSLGDPDALLPEVGQMLFRSGLVLDAGEFETWARYKNWMDLDGQPELLFDAYRRIARGERREAVVPGSAQLQRVVRSLRGKLQHNGAADIDEIVRDTHVSESALLLALGRSNTVTHIPGTNWVVSLGDARGSLRERIGKILSNLGPLTAAQIASSLAKARSGRETYATTIPEHVMAAVLDLTPGVSRDKPSASGKSMWRWNQPRVSLGESSDVILQRVMSLPAPFSRGDVYEACPDIPKPTIDVFISGPLCETVARDTHQLVGTMSE